MAVAGVGVVEGLVVLREAWGVSNCDLGDLQAIKNKLKVTNRLKA
jgi:hypothetical protein